MSDAEGVNRASLISKGLFLKTPLTYYAKSTIITPDCDEFIDAWNACSPIICVQKYLKFFYIKHIGEFFAARVRPPKELQPPLVLFSFCVIMRP